MDIVDIRSRLDSNEVRNLVNQLEYPLEIREEKTSQILKEYREHPDQPILGIESNGELVGIIGLRLQPPDGAVIRHIVVRRDHRGRGIGRQMIAQVCHVYSLSVLFAETDHDAVEFYRKVGFEIESLGEKYPGIERFFCKLKRLAW
jgi:ribosomal protein S18 acetylase RimI-like enzyme